MREQVVSGFVSLVSSFVERRIDADTFERQYLELWNANLEHRYPDDVYPILEEVFFDVDAYCSDDTIRGEQDLDADQLRASAAKAIEALRRLE